MGHVNAQAQPNAATSSPHDDVYTVPTDTDDDVSDGYIVNCSMPTIDEASLSPVPEKHVRETAFPPGCPVWHCFKRSSSDSEISFETAIVKAVFLDYKAKGKAHVFKVIDRDSDNNGGEATYVRQDQIAYGHGCPVKVKRGQGQDDIDGEILCTKPMFYDDGNLKSVRYSAVLFHTNQKRTIEDNIHLKEVEYRRLAGGAADVSKTNERAESAANEAGDAAASKVTEKSSSTMSPSQQEPVKRTIENSIPPRKVEHKSRTSGVNSTADEGGVAASKVAEKSSPAGTSSQEEPARQKTPEYFNKQVAQPIPLPHMQTMIPSKKSSDTAGQSFPGAAAKAKASLTGDKKQGKRQADLDKATTKSSTCGAGGGAKTSSLPGKQSKCHVSSAGAVSFADISETMKPKKKRQKMDPKKKKQEKEPEFKPSQRPSPVAASAPIGMPWRVMWNCMLSEGWSYFQGTGLVAWVYLHPTCKGMKKTELYATKEKGVDYFESEESLHTYARVNLGWRTECATLCRGQAQKSPISNLETVSPIDKMPKRKKGAIADLGKATTKLNTCGAEGLRVSAAGTTKPRADTSETIKPKKKAQKMDPVPSLPRPPFVAATAQMAKDMQPFSIDDQKAHSKATNLLPKSLLASSDLADDNTIKTCDRSKKCRSNPHAEANSKSKRDANITEASAAATQGATIINLTDQEKKEKERFLMFTRVLMKYLEQRDEQMHAKAKAAIKECYEQNKPGAPGYPHLTESIRARLSATVGEVYGNKGHAYLNQFLQKKKRKRNHLSQDKANGEDGEGCASKKKHKRS